jgi:hypothetical protein
MLESKAGGEYWHQLTFTRAEVLAEFPVIAEHPAAVASSDYSVLETATLGATGALQSAQPLPGEEPIPPSEPKSEDLPAVTIPPEGLSVPEGTMKSAEPKIDGIARVIPKCPPPSQRTRYSLWQVIMNEFPDGVPITMTVPDVARQLAENKCMIARGKMKKNLTDGKHNMLLKRLLERTRK